VAARVLSLEIVMLAQIFRGLSVGEFLIWVIVLAGMIGVALIVLRACGVAVPQWFWHIVGIVAMCFVAVVAIRFLASM
jgi:hypothetical protein